MRLVAFIFPLLFIIGCGSSGGTDGEPSRQQFASLGRKIFFDTSLSSPKGVACSTCHAPSAAFSDPLHTATSKGAVSGRIGTRNSPSIMYSLFSPNFGFSTDEGDYIGGQFWDGRAVDLEQQAVQPLIGHLEMNLGDSDILRQRIVETPYADELANLYGAESLEKSEQTLTAVVSALAAFENSEELRPFSSKYDAWATGKTQLSPPEQRGLVIFSAPNKGNCAACHVSTGEDGQATSALFTDFTYDNIGLPKNHSIGNGEDHGLHKTTGRPVDIGRFKVPTLRNIAVTAPYFHNGGMKTLQEVVRFYNRRDIDPSIGRPEFPATMNSTELSNLGLSDNEEEDLVAFLRTLTDANSVE